MRSFLDDDFLLDGECAATLYHKYASRMPIVDYHCHLSPREIAEDKRFSNITEAWLYGDHYKWRAMRCAGVDEKYITGGASDYEKFREYCKIMPSLIGNPLYHWSHLELQRYFNCRLTICEENCEEIWRITAKRLADADMSARQIIKNSGVKLLCTTDDPCDSLEYHKQIKESGYEVRVLPAFRPDKGMNIERRGIAEYIKRLGESNGVDITDLASLERAYLVALDRFEAHGCAAADHGMDNYVDFRTPDPYHADLILKKALASDGRGVTEEESTLFKSQMMRFFGIEYKKRGFVMQLHYGVLRNPNTEMYERLGADSGYDMIYGRACTEKIAELLNYLNQNHALPRTVIYPIDPSANAAVSTLCGSFCAGDGSGMPTVTQGSAWWFNDNIDGMRAQIKTYASLSSLGRFLGMLTDSRSLLSYPRHEYFRRVLCSVIGEMCEKGLYPWDETALSRIVEDISYNNAISYFSFDLS